MTTAATASPLTVWTTVAVIVVWLAVAIAVRLREPDRPLARLDAWLLAHDLDWRPMARRLAAGQRWAAGRLLDFGAFAARCLRHLAALAGRRLLHLADAGSRQLRSLAGQGRQRLSVAGDQARRRLSHATVQVGQRLSQAAVHAGQRLSEASTHAGQRLSRAVVGAGQRLSQAGTQTGQRLSQAAAQVEQRLSQAGNRTGQRLSEAAVRTGQRLSEAPGRARRGSVALARRTGRAAVRGSVGLAAALGRGALALPRLAWGTVVVTVLSVVRLTGATAVLVATAVLAATLVPPTASALTGALHVSNPAAHGDGGEVALPPLAERSRVLSPDDREVVILHGEINRRIVSLDEVPPLVRAAVITAEDRRFAEHSGFDPYGMGRAAWANLQRGAIVAGGSTITQQVAKANFTDGTRTLERKLQELAAARTLEAELGKSEILERYLNEVYMGRGAYGIAAASEVFFGRDPAALEVHQAALLAGVIAAPSRFDPDRYPERALERRNEVLEGMVEEGHLTEDHARLAASRPLDLLDHSEAVATDPYVVEQVKRELLDEPALGETRTERVEALFRGGLTIRTSVEPRLQRTADELIERHLGHQGPTAAIVVMDETTGQLLVTRSGRAFAEDQYDPALQGRRQPGSAFKAFVLAAALEDGAELDDETDASSPATLDFGGVRPWQVRNFGGADYGDIPLEEAFTRSSNTAFARLILDVGQPAVEDLMERLGIDVDAALGEQRGLSPAIALGGVAHGMTLPEMTAAFGALARDGTVVSPHVVTEVADRDGQVLLRREVERRRAVDRDIARQMRSAMRKVVEEGTGTRAQLPGHTVVGKTGTSQNFADAWFVGEVDGLVGAVWVGHPEGRVPMGRMTGGSLPAQLWASMLSEALAETGG